MMQRILIAVLAAAFSLGPARADYVIKDGNGASQTIKSGTVGGKILPQSTPADSSGTEIVPATQATLASILAKITNDPATQTTLAAILAKVSADPATQTTLAAFLSANHVDLAAILAKLPTNMAPMQATGGSITPIPTSTAVTKTAATVGTSSAQALSSGSRKYLKICNESGSAFAAYNFAGTAALNTAGNRTLLPYACDEFAESFVPSDAINMIASGAATPVTILSN